MIFNELLQWLSHHCREGGRRLQGKVLPFLLHNLDTGETTMMEKARQKRLRVQGYDRNGCGCEAFSQYKGEMHQQARAKAGPLQVWYTLVHFGTRF